MRLGKKLAANSQIDLRSDSELLVKQLKREYKVSNLRMQELFIQIWNLRVDFGKITFKAIPREKNKEADKMANMALDEVGRKMLL